MPESKTADDRITNAFDGWIQDAVICGKGQADAMDLRRNLVACIHAAVAEEREACAKLVETPTSTTTLNGAVISRIWADGATIAAAIRARIT